ncbi:MULTISPECIES: hypothetical protein [Streptomyces]|uniref:Uncharacterized protein n=2 Tax=Streptomyces TaxID=1883 RepID=A0A101PP52_STRCK|nr:hypothetical protein [Streptomyces corchorusii]KUN15094.1 hypothetical protein AQJ11_43835 [Streptomyces corchorusii]
MTVPRKLDHILDQAAIPDTVTDAELDAELDDLKEEIVRDVTAVLMFGERPTLMRHHLVRLERADHTLQALCRQLLRSVDASEHLARIADSPVDPEGALHFGCVLDLAKKPDGAMWWWQFAAGAGNATAAYLPVPVPHTPRRPPRRRPLVAPACRPGAEGRRLRPAAGMDASQR